MWSFVKNMVRKESIPAVEGYSIRTNHNIHNTSQEKAELFLSIFSGAYPRDIKTLIANNLNSQTPNPLNHAITFEELENSTPKS
ncbi:hypothetical protein OUZ56_005994 [Daphnia magna]|uniref:Uncharacterized protein n=1 Tax=Daphnia magna TaxID=35525 RepID=A0ABQ9YUA8_9CRUS|nr:hypothetical protein OUZ56_005994 [Daphnia magna]